MLLRSEGGCLPIKMSPVYALLCEWSVPCILEMIVYMDAGPGCISGLPAEGALQLA